MGLPIWRDPEEQKQKAAKDALKTDPTAAARSSIRRRPSVHGRRSSRDPRPPLARNATVHPPRLPRIDTPTSPHIEITPDDFLADVAEFAEVRRSQESRRNAIRGVPPVSTLLESADRFARAPPPPVPESRNYYDEANTMRAREHVLQARLSELRENADRLRRENRERHTLRMAMNAGREEFVRSQEAARPRQSNLPTPPLDTSEGDSDSLFVPETRFRSARGLHPLSNSWRPDSPVDGLGDRNRSPTPADGWEVMRSTITPDASLPSAESSFTSAAASQSFSSGQDTTPTEPEAAVSSNVSRRNSSDGDSVSSVATEDLVCDDETIEGAEIFAEDMYDFELSTPQGRQRIQEQREIRIREGNRFALQNEPESVDIGFRLIEEALDSHEGRSRLLHISVLDRDADLIMFRDVVRARRHPQPRNSQPSTAREPTIYDDEPPPINPGRYSLATQAAVRDVSRQVHDYFRPRLAGTMPRTRSRQSSSPDHFTGSPPPYQPLASHPDVNTFVSRDEPVAHPVSPPSQRSEREVADALLSGDEPDLGSMRRIVQRIARRDDVPEEWWMSMGLNLSRTRPRAMSPVRSAETAAGDRVRSGRIERGNSRL